MLMEPHKTVVWMGFRVVPDPLPATVRLGSPQGLPSGKPVKANRATIGNVIGWALYGRLNEAAFRQIVQLLLFASGIALLVGGR